MSKKKETIIDSLLNTSINELLSNIDAKIVYPLLRKRRLANKLQGITKLNLGCGRDLLDGWLNVALFETKNRRYGKLYPDRMQLKFDLTKPLPVRSGSVEFIYASHFIEHLQLQQGFVFLERCYEYLQEGGVIRLSCPDMELWIKNYIQGNMKFFKQYRDFFLGGESSLAQTKGEIFMSQVHNWEHQWNYDFESIKHLLEKTGFQDVQQKRMHDSRIPEVEVIEPDRLHRQLETGYFEAIK